MNNEIVKNDFTGIPDRKVYSAIIDQLRTQGIQVFQNILTIEDLELVEYLHLDKALELVGIDKCVNLKTLIMVNTELTDLTPISKLEKLTCLSLACNKISDLTPLSKVVSLEKLYLGRNEIKDISPLESLVNLESLALRGNEIKEIKFLKKLTNLKELSIEQNQIEDIDVLNDLVNITSLNISENNITDINALENIHHMKYLYMGYNNITDISPLVGMMELEKLELVGNEISIEDVDTYLFHEFVEDKKWLVSNGFAEAEVLEDEICEEAADIEEVKEESKILDTLHVVKEKIQARPIVSREWNTDTIDAVKDHKKTIIAIAELVSIVGVLVLLLRKKK